MQKIRWSESIKIKGHSKRFEKMGYVRVCRAKGRVRVWILRMKKRSI